jgi:hypothetical protein
MLLEEKKIRVSTPTHEIWGDENWKVPGFKFSYLFRYFTTSVQSRKTQLERCVRMTWRGNGRDLASDFR